MAFEPKNHPNWKGKSSKPNLPCLVSKRSFSRVYHLFFRCEKKMWSLFVTLWPWGIRNQNGFPKKIGDKISSKNSNPKNRMKFHALMRKMFHSTPLILLMEEIRPPSYCWWKKSRKPPGMYKTLRMMGWTTYQLVSRISEPSTVSPRFIPSSHISPLWLVKPPTQPKLFFTPAPRARCPPRQSSLQLAPLAAYHCRGSLDLIVASVSHFWGEGWFSRPILTYIFQTGLKPLPGFLGQQRTVQPGLQKNLWSFFPWGYEDSCDLD